MRAILIYKCSVMARVNEGSNCFTCKSRVYPHEVSHPAFGILSNRFYYAIIKNTASIYDDDYPYPLLAPTMLTLLQQQPRGHQQRKQPWRKAAIGPEGLRSAIRAMSRKKRGAWKCSLAITSSLTDNDLPSHFGRHSLPIRVR